MIFDKLTALEAKYEQMMAEMGTPAVQADTAKFRSHSKTVSELQPLVEAFREYKEVAAQIAGAEELLKDPDMRDLAQDELQSLQARREELLSSLKVMLIPKDPNDAKNVILEIRAGTGGEEAALFASDLFRMYSRYAERQGWKLEVLNMSDSGIIAMIEGRNVYSRLKYESGVHRVQRVPVTEASGRIHTSTATVAVLPGGRGSGRADPGEGPADRHVLLERPWRPERQYHLLGGAYHSPAERAGRVTAGREVTDQEPGEGDEGVARPAL